MTLRRRMYRPCRDENESAGFTAVEMVVAIVILGVVIGPIAFAARSAINFVPDAGDRSAIAIARSAMVDRFSQDAASATSMAVNGFGISVCPQAVSSTASTSTMFTFKRNYGTATTSSTKWLVEFKAGTAFGGRTGDMWPVRIYREYRADENAVSPTETTTYYNAYCARSTGDLYAGWTSVAAIIKPGGNAMGVAQSVGQHQTANLQLFMYDSYNDTATTRIAFNAVQRETCTDTVNGCP